MVDGIINEHLKSVISAQEAGIEEHLQKAMAYLGLTPEQFAEKYELETYAPKVELVHEFPSGFINLVYTSKYRLSAKAPVEPIMEVAPDVL